MKYIMSLMFLFVACFLIIVLWEKVSFVVLIYGFFVVLLQLFFIYCLIIIISKNELVKSKSIKNLMFYILLLSLGFFPLFFQLVFFVIVLYLACKMNIVSLKNIFYIVGLYSLLACILYFIDNILVINEIKEMDSFCIRYWQMILAWMFLGWNMCFAKN